MPIWRVKMEEIAVTERWVTVEGHTRELAVRESRDRKNWLDEEPTLHVGTEMIPIDSEQQGGYDEEPDSMDAYKYRTENQEG
jgi:hypothetical protein